MHGKLNKTGEVLGFNVFNEIVVVHSSDALKAIDKVTLGRQTSCSPTLHKHNGVMHGGYNPLWWQFKNAQSV